MEDPYPMDLVERDALIERGNFFKREMFGLCDLQVLSFLETFYAVDLCQIIPADHPYRLPLMRLLGLIFEEFRDEILADPPTLTFVVLLGNPTAEVPSDNLTEQLESAIKHWESARASRINARYTTGETSATSAEIPLVMTRAQLKAASDSNGQASALNTLSGSSGVPVQMAEPSSVGPSDTKAQARAVKSSASSNKAPPNMSEANPVLGTDNKAQGRGVKLSSASCGIPVAMAKAKSKVASNPKIRSDAVESSASTTKARLNWEPSNSEDPFGLRVSTEEFGTMQPPFELALTGKFNNVRDNILYDVGYRDATAHFEELPAQIVQPLQPGVDLTPEPVKAYTAANTARNEAAKSEIKDNMDKKLDIVGAQEITTARGLREEFTNVDPTYTDTMFVAVAAAKLESTPDDSWDKLSNEALRELRAELKAKGKDYGSGPIRKEEALAQSSLYDSSDAPTEEEEISAKGWVFPVADRVVDKAQIHYDMMYQVVTKMQRDRLELGPEISDYEVIATAHASYVAVDKNEATALERAAETQKTQALACSVSEELRKAQEKGLPITSIGGLELTQKDIADVLERCAQVGSSSSAAVDYTNAKLKDCKDAHDDPFTRPERLASAGSPQKAPTIGELVAGARIGITANKNRTPAAPAARFNAAVDKIERDLAAMRAFKSRIGTAPRDFSGEIAEIQLELAELKAHRAAAPGDLVPDGIDDKDYVGIAVGHGVEDGAAEKPKEEDDAESASAAKKLSRAELRRAARQKAKGKGRE